MRKKTFSFILTLFFLTSLFSQEEIKSDWQKKLENLNIKTSVTLQLWAVYTNGMEIYNYREREYEDVANRLNFTLHRSRYGISLQPYKNLKFKFSVAADFVGRDALTALEPGQNNGSNPAFRLWNTYLQLRTQSGSERSFLTFGYFPVRIGRESLTNAVRSTSMEKAWSQNYLRRHVTGIGPGRAVGLNWGGLQVEDGRWFSMQYDLGFYTPVAYSFEGNSQGEAASPLAVGRVVFMIGDPESKKYKMNHQPNYFGKRKGISIGLAGAVQGNTDLFKNSTTYGVDALINVGQLNVDGEWHFLSRETIDGEATATANTGYLRVSYNFPLQHGFVLETAAAAVRYFGQNGGRITDSR